MDGKPNPIPYDTIIIGAGPAGMAAAMYHARYGLKTLLLTMDVGGQMATADKVENYPGYKSIHGMELMQRFMEQVEYLGCEVKYEQVTDAEKRGDLFSVTTTEGTYAGKTLLITAGVVRRKLGAPGEEEFAGRGVSYCATCDGAFFRDKVVAVVGGGDAAATGALLLSQNAKQVTVLVRADKMRAEPVTQKHLQESKNVTILYNAQIKEIAGGKKVEKVVLTDGRELALDGVFIEIGGQPNSQPFGKLGIRLNEKGEILVDAHKATNVPGIYAAGDITDFLPEFRQAVVSAAAGSIASNSIYHYLKHQGLM